MKHAKKDSPTPPKFYGVSQVADILGISDMTIYRAIGDDEFPAVKIRGRFVIPARAIDDIEEAAVDGQRVVDAADFTPGTPEN
ncbi:helix-turn-helix domain-containing protein [Amycolatopsis anabasis]|uniref:helix-turn-helix domain-containing protein n=1 Tax=Amycolatopsis anabasis TaxID=1840409 RepID=UPI00131AF25C|nr:helix-turn-helix domain-containing protein [Amycolatopsis anabasis]